MSYLGIAGYLLLLTTGGLSLVLLLLGRGRAISLVFLYLLAYEGLYRFLNLPSINRYDDLAYLSLAIAIDVFWFYFFLNRSLYFLALIVGFDAIYAGANLILLQSGINVLDVIYSQVGVAVSVLLLIGGGYRGFAYRYCTSGDSWNISWKAIVRPLSTRKG